MKIKEMLNPANMKNFVVSAIKGFPGFVKTSYLFINFFVLLLIFLFAKSYSLLERIFLLGFVFRKLRQVFGSKISSISDFIIKKIETGRHSEVQGLYLIELAYRNMMIKKTRSLITILGMSVGVGAIVLLLSFGYGVERLIVNKVARLDELKMIDVSAGENTTSRLSEDIYKKIKKIKDVDRTLPIISVVGRISYNRATTDVLVYAVPEEYQSILSGKITKGKFFVESGKNNPLTKTAEEFGQVAGAKTSMIDAAYDTKISSASVYFNVLPEAPIIAWEKCEISSKILGYVPRIEGGYQGEEYWGSDYYPFSQNGRVGYDKNKNIFLGRWIKAKLPLFQKKSDETLVPLFDDHGRHIHEEVCISEKDIQITDRFSFAQVLGESTESASVDESLLALETDSTASDSAEASDSADLLYSDTVVSTGEAGMEFVSLEATASASVKKSQETIKIDSSGKMEAVVSNGFLNLLGISENKAIGTKFKTSFIIVKSLMPEIQGKVMTSEVEYVISGVVDDPDNTYFFVPFADLYQIGVKNFSQIKVIISNPKSMQTVRKMIETMGLKTNSTVDTVKQIESLFANLRILLAVLGMVALGVASLGMFNTLTVSLLERTRETGGMKAIGMVSDEVQDLFLAEAMIMGLSGGIGGLSLGWGTGELISFLVSIVAISKGQGYIHLNYVPFYFVVFIIISSFIVGLLTGLYPAYRAKKTSALNALRYE